MGNKILVPIQLISTYTTKQIKYKSNAKEEYALLQKDNRDASDQRTETHRLQNNLRSAHLKLGYI
jgi:hypothetical protein